MEAIARENDLYSASLESFARARFAGEPEWLVSLRREAFERFTALGFPTTKNEEWKYTSVGPIAKVPFRPLPLSPREREGGEGAAGATAGCFPQRPVCAATLRTASGKCARPEFARGAPGRA